MPHTKETIAPVLLSDQGVAALLGVSRASVWRRVNDQTFPQPIRIGGLTRWSKAENEAGNEAKMAERDNPKAA